MLQIQSHTSYKYTVSTPVNPDSIFRNSRRTLQEALSRPYEILRYTNHTSFPKYIWEIKEKHQENLSFKWSIVKRLSAYSDITKKYLLCLHEKLEIVNYPHPEELLNKRSELVSKCRHANKYLLKNYKANH